MVFASLRNILPFLVSLSIFFQGFSLTLYLLFSHNKLVVVIIELYTLLNTKMET
jgi:hypothetical protein